MVSGAVLLGLRSPPRAVRAREVSLLWCVKTIHIL